ncbi:hypothetical protein [Gorillibacterium massiliense]|uniref:hypothetical protein n=1 Tax=Gorillibacterium massiliense TaxID=1280390 RepID=UPI0012DED61C|nr:hypothetical protein [Gorillibacterium massiliense]
MSGTSHNTVFPLRPAMPTLVCLRIFGEVDQADNPARQSGGATRPNGLKPLGFVNTRTLSAIA